MQFPAWLCLPLIVFTYSTRTILWLLLLVFRSTKNNVDNVAQNLLVALRNICCLFDSGAHHKMSSLSSPATGSLQIKWDPKNLEIRTKSVEKTLEPLVTQVCFPFLSPYFTVHRGLCFYCVFIFLLFVLFCYYLIKFYCCCCIGFCSSVVLLVAVV